MVRFKAIIMRNSVRREYTFYSRKERDLFVAADPLHRSVCSSRPETVEEKYGDSHAGPVR